MRGWILSACACALSLVAPIPATACYNGVEHELVTETRQTRSAETLLARGRIRRAVRVARRALAQVERRPRGDRRRRQLHPRLVRVLALATVRLGGAVERPRWRTPSSMPSTARQANLRWALDRLFAPSSASPVQRAQYGEALVALRRFDLAANVLLPLAEEDLMPDAYGFVALARAQDGLGHASEAERARRGCEAVASRAQRGLCHARPQS